jgi:5'-nucleotidase
VRILVTNDDGIEAPGICALVRGLSAWAAAKPAGERPDIVVVAPDSNQSGMSSAVGDVFSRDSITYTRHAIPGAEHIEAYGIEAAPALCTIVASRGAFGPSPDLVVSGINLGVNVGRSVLHSGTVGAILTGGQLGLSGLAVSMQAARDVPLDDGASVAAAVLDELIAAPPRTLLNLNIPALGLADLKGVKRARISSAGIIKRSATEGALAPSSLAVGESSQISLSLGAAVPQLGDTSDEESDDDGAVVNAGYAALTLLRGISEAVDDASDVLMRSAVAAIDAHLALS